MLKNKKGIAWFIPMIIGTIVLLIVGGGITAWKANKIISSVPSGAWWAILIIIILIILPKKKR